MVNKMIGLQLWVVYISIVLIVITGVFMLIVTYDINYEIIERKGEIIGFLISSSITIVIASYLFALWIWGELPLINSIFILVFGIVFLIPVFKPLHRER